MDAMFQSGSEERQMYSHNQCVQYMCPHICGYNKDMNRAGILALLNLKRNKLEFSQFLETIVKSFVIFGPHENCWNFTVLQKNQGGRKLEIVQENIYLWRLQQYLKKTFSLKFLQKIRKSNGESVNSIDRLTAGVEATPSVVWCKYRLCIRSKLTIIIFLVEINE